MTSHTGCGGSPNHPFEGASSLLEALAEQPGLMLSTTEDLSRRTTFRIGGPAEIFADVRTEAGLSALLSEIDLMDAPLFFLGIGSNVLIPDEGLPGVVATLGGDFGRVEIDGLEVRAGAAASLSKLARATASRGLIGLEALAGFPSSVGGAVRMNAGCYGTEICDVLLEVRVVDCEGESQILPVAELGAGYRSTRLQETGHIVTEARFRLRRGDAEIALARISELNRRRWQSLPSGTPHAGSVFRNPADDSAGRLIEACGLKGVGEGGARISTRHANVIVNEGGAHAADVLILMARSFEAVAERFGILLEPEVVLAGTLESRWREQTAEARRRFKAR